MAELIEVPQSKSKGSAITDRSFQVNTDLPLWASHKRAVPNVLARACLFRVGSVKHKRQYYDAKKLASQKGTSITYTGYELRQDDADIFFQLIHLQRNSTFEHGVEFLTSPMLKSLGRSVNTKYNEKLKRSLMRLTATALLIETEDSASGAKSGYCGSLIQSFSFQDEHGNPSRTWRVKFDPKIVSMFEWASYSQFDWQARLSLGPLAKFLHLYYASHKKPYALKCETIQEICGSAMSQLKHFRQELNEAGEELVKVGFLESYAIQRPHDTFLVVKSKKSE